MTAVTSAHTASSRRKATVGFGDLVWLTARQHRLTVGIIVGVYVLYGLLVELGGDRIALDWWEFDPKVLLPGLAGVIAVFLGAPLLGTEYEQRTHLLAWSQDVSPVRWLTAKLTLLGGTVVVLSGLLALLARVKTAGGFIQSPGVYAPDAPYGWIGFESWPPLAIGYAVFGFVFGVAAGALCRRTVAAMGITLAGFAAIRFLIAGFLRPWLLSTVITPIRQTYPLSTLVTPGSGVPSGYGVNDYAVNLQLWLTASGQPVDVPGVCYGVGGNQFVDCMTGHGITQVGEVYQPYDRLLSFQCVELALYVVLIAICVGYTVWSVRRRAVS